VCVVGEGGGLHSRLARESRLLEVGARSGYSRDRAALVSNGDGAPIEESGWDDVAGCGGREVVGEVGIWRYRGGDL